MSFKATGGHRVCQLKVRSCHALPLTLIPPMVGSTHKERDSLGRNIKEDQSKRNPGGQKNRLTDRQQCRHDDQSDSSTKATLVFFKNFIEQKYFNSHHVVGDTVPEFDLHDSYMHLILS